MCWWSSGERNIACQEAFLCVCTSLLPSTTDMAPRSNGDYLKIVSWNVKGLQSPSKWMQILRHLKHLWANLALLQETHLFVDNLSCLRKSWVGAVYGSPAVGLKAGVAILLHKNLRHTMRYVRTDWLDWPQNYIWRSPLVTLLSLTYMPQNMVSWIIQTPEAPH